MSEDWTPPADPGDDTTARLSQLKGRLLDSAALDKIPPLAPLVDGWLYLDSLTWITGKPGNAKSFVVLDMAGSISEGIPWCSTPVKQGPVLYVIAEGLSGIRQRVRAWEEYHGRAMGSVAWLPGPLSLIGDSAAISEIARQVGAVLVVFDTQAMVTPGMDEISSRDMGMIVNAAERVRETTGACIVMVHHEAVHGERPRGHSTMDGAATTLLRVVKDGQIVWVVNTKQKDGPKHATLSLQVQLQGESLVLIQTDPGSAMAMADSEQTVYRELAAFESVKGGATFSELKDACGSRGVTGGTYTWALNRLKKHGRIRNTGSKSRTWYVTVDPGQARLDEQDGEEQSK